MITWWKNSHLVSIVFGGAVATIYVLSLFLGFQKFEYNGLKDILEKLFASILPLWLILSFGVSFLYFTLGRVFEHYRKKIGYKERAKYGLPILCYFLINLLSLLISSYFNLDLFNTFASISTLSIGTLFASSMFDVINSLPNHLKKT